MRFGISIPQDIGAGFDPAALRDYLTEAESLGFASAWALEQVLGSRPMASPLETLSFAAACTSRIRLGCAVFVTPLHNPVHLAKALSTVDNLSGGRLDVGIGTGGPNRPFAAFDAERASYLSRFTEGLAVMRALWTRESVTFDGEHWQLTDASMSPKPVQRPHPPVWFGASGMQALRRTAKLADAFIGAGSSTTAKFAEQVTALRGLLAEAGRDVDTFPIGKRVYIAVDDDASVARQRIGEQLRSMYAHFSIDALAAVAVAGTVDDCVRGLREVVDAGAELVVLNPLYDDAAQMRRLAADVVPHISTGRIST